MRLKRVFLVATGFLAALFFLDACGSDSGSSAPATDVEGLWSIYEPDPDKAGFNLALAWNSGLRNKPSALLGLKNQFLQLTSEPQFASPCPGCGQSEGGLRLYGVFLSINNGFKCTPDLGNRGPLPYGKWMTFYAQMDGNQITNATLTGSIQQGTCQQSEHAGSIRGPDNCGWDGVAPGDLFPSTFSYPVEVQLSGEVVFEEVFPGVGYCKLVFEYDKTLLPDSTTGEPASEALAERCDASGSMTLYRSTFKTTQPGRPDPTPWFYEGSCGSNTPPYRVSSEGVVTDYPEWAFNEICGTRDAYRFEREAMTEEQCLSLYQDSGED